MGTAICPAGKILARHDPWQLGLVVLVSLFFGLLTRTWACTHYPGTCTCISKIKNIIISYVSLDYAQSAMMRKYLQSSRIRATSTEYLDA